MTFPVLLALFASAAGLSWALSRLVRQHAICRGAVVPPRSDRWHRSATPTFGGIAIVTTALVLASMFLMGAPSIDEVATPLAVVLAAFAMFAVGLVDDGLRLTPLAKLVASLAIGAFFVFSLSTPGALPPWAAVLAIIWFGGVVHALNLLDNMDGLAAGIGLLAALFFVWTFGSVLGPILSTVLVAVAGSLLGFLVWNRHPARLFMGDCGSLFIGAVLAGTSLVPVIRPDTSPLFDGFVIVLILVVPLFDTGFVLLLRRLAGRQATRGGTDHVSHRLVSLGFSERSAVRILYGFSLLGGALAVLLTGQGDDALLPLAWLFVVAMPLVGIYLARVPAYESDDFLALQKTSFAPFLKDLAFRWHAGQVLLDVLLISAVVLCVVSNPVRRRGTRGILAIVHGVAADRARVQVGGALSLWALRLLVAHLRAPRSLRGGAGSGRWLDPVCPGGSLFLPVRVVLAQCVPVRRATALCGGGGNQGLVQAYGRGGG